MGFLSNLLGFQNSFTKNLGKDILSNPTRLITGIDPASTKLWNTVLNRDDKALVNIYGSPGQQYYEQAQQEGIDTSAANKFHGVADTVAGIYGGSGLAGSLGFGGLGSASGPSNISGLLGNAGNIGKIANSVTSENGQNSGGNNMGFLDGLFGSSGSGGSGLGGLVAGIGGALLGAAGGKGSNNQTQTTQQQLDPRAAAILYGEGGNGGLLSYYQGLLNQPQTLGSQVAGQLSSNYLAGAAPDDVKAIRDASLGLINANAPSMQFNAPSFTNPLWVSTPQAQAARFNAPGQNALDLSGAFSNTIYGNAAENPYLQRSLSAGAELGNAAFNRNLGNLTDTLERRVLPGVRGGAIAAGQYGGSRQGIAEGLAMSDFTRQATDAAREQGLATTQGILGAQTGAFESGQNRALSALQGLSGQQYGAAGQNASMQQQANLANLDADLRAQLANQQSGTSVAQGNQQAQLATNALNAQNMLQANSQNNAARIAGLGSLQGLLGQMYGYNQNAQNADLMRAQGVNSLLSPYLGLGQSSTTNTPLYQNQGANILGGAAAGLGLYNQFRNIGGGGSSTTPNFTNAGQYNWGAY